MSPRERWSKEVRERALELYAAQGLDAAVSETGVPKATLRSWVKPAGGVPESGTPYLARVARLANQFGDLAAAALIDAGQYLAAGQPGKAQQSVIVAGISVDKAQLLSGQATSRSEVGSTPDELDARLLELVATLKAQRDAAANARAIEAGATETKPDPEEPVA